MKDYKTVEEKAAEWGLSSRHIQYLCRNGKISGTVKRAGSWFIPDDTPSPARNSKSNNGNFSFTGTKKRIFNSAIELFALSGFDNVSLRDIAEKVGIRQSTIYNHFKSKQEILDSIYDFYCHHFLKDRPSLNDMKTKLQNEDLINVLSLLRYDFDESYRQKMSDIAAIVFQRIAIDDRAREIAKSLMMEDGRKYAEAVLNEAIAAGRFAPFDTYLMSVFISSVRIFTFYNWITDPSPSNMIKCLEDEQALYKQATKFIKELGI